MCRGCAPAPESGLSSHYVGSGDGIHVSRHIYLLSHLSSPKSELLKTQNPSLLNYLMTLAVVSAHGIMMDGICSDDDANMSSVLCSQ